MSEALTRCSTLTAGYEFNFLYSFIHPSSDRDQILWSKVAKISICVLSLLCVVPLVTSGLGCFSMGEHQRQIKRWHVCYFVIIGFVFFFRFQFQHRTMSTLGHSLSLDSRPLSRLSTHNTSSETNVVVAWLERFEDHAQFPVDDLLMEFDICCSDSTRSLFDKETVVIFIHHLRSGLYRIHIRSTIR